MTYRDIDSIVNVSAYAVLETNGEWTYGGSYMTCPDEIVVRQVTYMSVAPKNELWVIKSNLGLLGSVVPTAGFQSNPGTRIQVREPLSGPLTFKLFVPTLNSLTPAITTALDMVSVELDFIRYRR